MPYVTNNGVSIHYHVEGEGPALVLQHGQSDNIKGWYEAGHVEALKDEYRLVIVDARGHGESDKPHDAEAYDIKHNVADIVAILDELGIDKAHYWGHSMGGRIGFGCAKYAKERFYSLIISSMSPYKRPKEERDKSIAQLLQGTDAVIAARKAEGELTEEEEAKIRANDPLAQAASLTAVRDLPDQTDTLQHMTMPSLVYVGELDTFWREGLERCIDQIPNATFVGIARSGPPGGSGTGRRSASARKAGSCQAWGNSCRALPQTGEHPFE